MSRFPETTLTRARTRFRWDEQSQRYRESATGRFVTQAAVSRAVQQVIDGAKAEISALARDVADGTIEVSDWQTRMASVLKSLHLAATASARGGFPNLTASDYGRTGAALRRQYEFLDGFANDIAAGRLTAPRIVARAELYSGAAHGTHEEARLAGAEAVGLTECRNILGDAEHCPECIAEAMRGWVGIGELSLPGTRLCKVNCRCSLLYR